MAAIRPILFAVAALVVPAWTAPNLQRVPPVLFEIEANTRYASTDLYRWEVFTRQGVHLGGSLTLEFLGIDPGMKLEGQRRTPPTLGLFYGNDPSRWRAQCASFESVVYRGLYPGIDLVYRRLDGTLKGDFILHPGADPGRIRFRFTGAEVSLDGDRIRIQTAAEALEEHIPAVYEIPGGRPLQAKYRRLEDNAIGFDVAGHDPSRQLVIDPNLTFSTFVAGSMLDQVTATVFSPTESMLLVTGWTESGDLLGANPSTYRRGSDGYYGRFSVTSTGVVALSSMTLFGGSGADKPLAISVSPSGAVAIAGTTSSSNFPTLLAYQTALSGTSDGFLMRFPSASTAFSSSTYLGGTGTEQVTGVALDSNGKLYFAGTTSSRTLPVTAGATQLKGSTDGFVGTLSSGSSPTLGYLTFLGGSGTDSIAGLAQVNGEVYLTGATDSFDFPVSVNPFQPTSGGGQDAFVTKLNATGLVAYSTYLGGVGGTVGQPEMGTAIAVSAAGEAYVTGVTSSSNFPVTSGAPQRTLNTAYGQPDAFLTKLTGTGGVAFSTFWGGSSWEQSNAVTILRNGLIAIAGQTSSLDFPLQSATQSVPGSGGYYDAFVSIFTSTGTVLYSSYFGGSGADTAYAVAGTPTNDVFVGGSTGSYDMPKMNALQSIISSSGYHGFLARFSPSQQAGIYRPDRPPLTAGGFFYLSPDFNFSKGTAYSWKNVTCANPQPVVGDWDNTGSTRIGLFCDGTWYLDIDGDNLFTSADRTVVNFGVPADFGSGIVPVVGDWDNSGKARLGFFQNGIWFLDLVGDYMVRYNPRSPCTTPDCPVIALGAAGDYPIVGDFANNGKTRLGIVRYNHWLLDLDGDYQTDTNYNFGTLRDYFIFGDWTNSGIKRIGIFRSYQDQFGNLDYPSGWWFLDITGNNFLDNIIYPCAPDRCVSNGAPGDLPVVGVRGSWR